MSTLITGIATNGVVVPSSALPEGAQVEIQLKAGQFETAQGPVARITAADLRKMPHAGRQTILASAAALAQEDYCTDKELTGFCAFIEEDLDGAEPDSK